MSEKKSNLTVVDDRSAPVAYANQIAGTEFDGAAFTLTFGQTRMKTVGISAAHEGVECYIAARLILSPAAAADLANRLSGMLRKMAETQAGQSGDKPEPLGA